MSFVMRLAALFAALSVVAASRLGAEDAVLSGGETTYFVDGTVHKFRESGRIVVTRSGEVEVLIVGGGGSGGYGKGGGGGAGGVVYKESFTVEADEYDVVVGAGAKISFKTYSYDDEPDVVYTNAPRAVVGEAVCTTNTVAAMASESSSVFGLVAHGGGNGGVIRANGGAGASGGGAGAFNASETHRGGSALYGEDGELGNKGGDCVSQANYAGGGGGAAGVGGDATSSKGGDGGAGYACSITGKTEFYGGGGGGGASSGAATSVGLGGVGGGGDGGRYNGFTNTPMDGEDGEPNTGGGGGGGGFIANKYGLGGNGGSGVVIVRTKHRGYVKFFDDGVGGVVTKVGEWRVHTFTNSDEVEMFSLPHNGLVDVLLVGGGGGGGALEGGGGGGGGVLVMSNVVVEAGAWPVVVGVGGDPATGSDSGTNGGGTNGGDSTVFGLTAWGGGAGGTFRQNGKVGASGGGGGGFGGTETHAGGAAKVGEDGSVQGHAGGRALWGFVNASSYGAGGGGGGAGAPGMDTVRSYAEHEDGSVTTNLVSGGAGGDGIMCDFSGEPTYYGGGGGGGNRINYTSASGGLGGGGKSGYYAVAGTAGTPNTGGGGGGAGGNAWNYKSGGAGGSGIVVIRYRMRPRGMRISIK